MIISDYTIQNYTTSLSTEHVTRVTLLQGFQERRGPFAQVTEHASILLLFPSLGQHSD